MSKIIIFCIRLYQKILSPLFLKSCRYNVSCSQYTILSLQRFGVFLGLFWSIKRILNCNPWNKKIIEEV